VHAEAFDVMVLLITLKLYLKLQHLRMGPGGQIYWQVLSQSPFFWCLL
jgi:hypothetical protein